MTYPDHLNLLAQRSHFKWTSVFDGALRGADWHQHLTTFLVAIARVSVSLQGQEPLPLSGVQLLDDPLGLYQVTTHEYSVEVRVPYRSLGQPFLQAPYDCHLLLKTPAGERFVTLPPPKPPDPAEWQHLVRRLWFHILLAGGDMTIASTDGTHSSGKKRPLYTFKLDPELIWEEAPVDLLSGQASAQWRRELRLVTDTSQPGLIHAQVSWYDAQSMSATSLEEAAATVPSTTPRHGSRLRWRRLLRASGKQESSTPRLEAPRPPDARSSRFSSIRVFALLTAIVLLSVLAAVAVSATRSRPGTSLAVATSTLPATLGPLPSEAPSALPTTEPTGVPTASPLASPTTRPSPSATAGHPSPTPTRTPSPTPTPSPTQAPSPTPAPIVNFLVTPTAFVQSCTSTPNPPALMVTLDNTGSTVAVDWQISISDTDPAGNVWATASQISGTVPAGQSATVTITPTSTLCQDMTGASGAINYTAIISNTPAGSTNQATVTDTVSP